MLPESRSQQSLVGGKCPVRSYGSVREFCPLSEEMDGGDGACSGGGNAVMKAVTGIDNGARLGEMSGVTRRLKL